MRVDESKKLGGSPAQGSCYLALKNEESLVGDQRERLDALLAANVNLNGV